MEKVQKPKKIFNPQTMVRYDEVVAKNDKKSIWVCKFCLTVLLSPVSAVTHHAFCKPAPTKRSTRIQNIRAAETIKKAEEIQAAAKIQVAKKTRVTKRVQLTKKIKMAPYRDTAPWATSK
uniref:Uncharacterized protein n=1 Tax=Schizaphis graminum TaxID=13262 RepID=A0A2S2NQ32_SCHGA